MWATVIRRSANTVWLLTLTEVCGLAGMTPTEMDFQGSGPRPMCCSAVLIMPVACLTCPAAAVFTAGILPGAASAAVTSTCNGQPNAKLHPGWQHRTSLSKVHDS